MARGSALSQGSSGENISHFTAIRLRVVGTGNLNLRIYTLDDIRNQVLVPLPMTTSTEVIPTRLCGMTTQRASFEGQTTVIDEFFKINRIVVFSKEVATSFPG